MFRNEIEPDYRKAVHYLPLPEITNNVRCLNGSAHIPKTAVIEAVTCELCRSEDTCKEFWAERATRKTGAPHPWQK
jgi:hypothetical protein